MAYRFDRSGEIPTRAALGFAATALAVAFLAPLLPREAPEPTTDVRSPDQSAAETPEDDERVTIVAREGLEAALGAVGLTVIAAAPLSLRNLGLFKLGQRVSAALLAVGVLVTIRNVGVLYVPSTFLMVLAATRHPPRDPFR